MVVVALAAAGSALAGGMNGTWSGRFIIPQEVGNVPTSAYPVSKLVVGPTLVTETVTGKTMATHDPENAVSTCVMRFRFASAMSTGGWRMYEQVGKPVLSGAVSGGMPEFSVCQRHDPSGTSKVVLRIRPAGSKLKSEFGDHFRSRPPDFGPGGLLGYLHH